VHFVGRLEYHDYLNLLQVSSVHVYLTYPFVLSWSFIEAMASGCLVLGSSTPPVLEVLRDGINGWSVDFFSPKGLADRILDVLEHPTETRTLRNAARTTAVTHYDLNRVLLPRWQRLMQQLIDGRRPLLHPDAEARVDAAQNASRRRASREPSTISGARVSRNVR